MADESRPDPRALLTEIERESERRGHLKIFLGYSPGVGKTYTMLEKAQQLKDTGVDVVVGLVETHSRRETQVLLDGLEVMPTLKVPYGDLVLEELDTDAILKRKPALVLVDELAHTNIGNREYEKRYQDVERLIASGIDVYTTVNVQHFEGLNDIITQLTGIRVAETVPDHLLDHADEIEVIDIPIIELLQRLQEGKVYIPEQARQAMQSFFTRRNLLSLRELTLRRVATKLDDELVNYAKARAIGGSVPAAERLLVCVSPSPWAKQLVRKAHLLASDLKASWFAVHVETTLKADLSSRQLNDLTDALNLAEELGAKIVILSGDHVTPEVVKFAEREKITKIIVGNAVRSGLRRLFNRSPSQGIIAATTDADIYIVQPADDEKIVLPVGQHRRRFKVELKSYLMGLLTVLPVFAVALVLFNLLHIGPSIVVFLIATIVSAFLFGVGPSILSSIISILLYDFFFIEPRLTFNIAQPGLAIDLLIFLGTALVVGQLTRLIRRGQESLRLRLNEIQLISDMSRELLSIPTFEELYPMPSGDTGEYQDAAPMLRNAVLDIIADIMVKYLKKELDFPILVMFRSQSSELKVWASSDLDLTLSEKEQAIAEWVYTHNEIAGSGTRTLSSIPWFFMPVNVKENVYGIIGIRADYSRLLPHERYIAGAIANLLALEVEKYRIVSGTSSSNPPDTHPT
jgi:two-component system sensor histidine kinase KdpD